MRPRMFIAEQKHIRLSELTDRELIPDEILRLIVNAFVIEKCGVEIIKQEVWNGIKVLSGGRKSIELPLSDAELNFR